MNKRTQSLLRLCPNIFNFKTVLYIGARNDRFDYGKDFKGKIDVLEIFKENVNHLKKVKFIDNVIHCDVRNPVLDKKYELVFWWHGPEHIYKEEFEQTLNNLEKITTKCIIMACPWGRYKQGEIYGNPNEKHVSQYDKNDFQKYGFKVETIGEQHKKGSNITAVKFIEDKNVKF